jgi:hypothetical protein
VCASGQNSFFANSERDKPCIPPLSPKPHNCAKRILFENSKLAVIEAPRRRSALPCRFLLPPPFSLLPSHFLLLTSSFFLPTSPLIIGRQKPLRCLKNAIWRKTYLNEIAAIPAFSAYRPFETRLLGAGLVSLKGSEGLEGSEMPWVPNELVSLGYGSAENRLSSR